VNVQQVIRRALFWGVISTAVVVIVASVAGALVAELSGMLAALVGGAIGFALLALTPLSIMWGFRAGKGSVLAPGFFALVLGVWMVKFIAFVAIIFLLGDVEAFHRETLFLTIVASLLAALISDLVVVIRSRMPYVDVELPGPST
jgi:uncharacterized PurR-regulated membrane protein YhhQ (DUF165 family)